MNPSVLSAEGLSGLVFFVFVAATLAGAVIAVGVTGLVRAVAGLALCFIGVAGLYWYLESPFVALMQVLIYVGAVCVTIIFAVMLADTAGPKQPDRRGAFVAAMGVVTSLALVWALSTLGLTTGWQPAGQRGLGTLEEMGTQLLTTYGLSFELISVVLLVAIVGSLALARQGRDKQ